MEKQKVFIYKVLLASMVRLRPYCAIGVGRISQVWEGEYVKLYDKWFENTEYVTKLDKCSDCGVVTEKGKPYCEHNSFVEIEQRHKKITTISESNERRGSYGFVESCNLEFVGEFWDDEIEEFTK